MISGGNATVYVSDMDTAVRFYTETLGLTLTNRFGNHWATLEAGPCYWTHGEAGLTIEQGSRVRLTREGRVRSNELFVDLLG